MTSSQFLSKLLPFLDVFLIYYITYYKIYPTHKINRQLKSINLFDHCIIDLLCEVANSLFAQHNHDNMNFVKKREILIWKDVYSFVHAPSYMRLLDEKINTFTYSILIYKIHLRNEFHFSGVHGAMNRSGSRAK